MNRTSVEVERRALELYNEGHSQAEIAKLLGLSGQGLVASILKRTPGYQPRETLGTFKPGAGRITAKAAAEKHGLNPPTLCKAIEQGKFPSGMTHLLAGGRRGHTVDETTFADEVAQLPRCGHVGCDKPALSGRACSGPHARALE